MLTVAEAHEQIARCVSPLSPQRLRLGELLSLRLAEDVVSQVDSPPFDKSQVDGYAIATSDTSESLRELELVTAGGVPHHAVRPGTTIRVMTGAPTPDGADAVVKWEDCEVQSDGVIRNPAASVNPGSCILRRGTAFHVGQTLLKAGKPIDPLDIALIAEIGQAEASVYPRPRVGVLATGDELVAAHEPLGPGQIRNTNGPMLLAALANANMMPIDLGVGRDDPADLREKISLGLECDVLLISGGVSAGVLDLVPGVLKDLGVAEVFHKVRVKPGKPLWFGTREAGGRTALVFGLPGNPVSTYVAFVLFVAPALRALAGGRERPSVLEVYPITTPFRHRGGRPTYHPCRLAFPGKDKTPSLELLDWKGSADLATLARAHYLAVLPEGDYELAAGDKVTSIRLG